MLPKDNNFFSTQIWHHFFQSTCKIKFSIDFLFLFFLFLKKGECDGQV